MNKNYKNVMLFTLFAIFFAYLGSTFTKPKEVIKYEERIKIERDTIKIVEKEIEYKTKYREKLKEQEKLIVFDTIACKEIVNNLKDQLANCDSIVVFKDVIIEKEREIIKYTKPRKKPFVVGGGIEKRVNEYPFNINAGFKINNTIILGTVNTKGEVGAKVLYNF